MKKSLIWVVTAGWLAISVVWGEDTILTLEKPEIGHANSFYVGNGEPLLPSPLIKLPLKAITPSGWIRKQLQLQVDGFHGHLAEISDFLKKDNNGWLNPDGQGQRGWEEVPYWLKGFGDAAYILDDKPRIEEARGWIEAAIKSQRDDGFFGPRSNLASIQGKPDLWPNMIMLAALQSWYDYSGDKRVLDLMTRYFKWEMTVPEENFLLPFWQQQRGADNLESVYWLYNRTGEKWLLELASKIYRHTANWTDGVANWHNVNMSQAFDGPGVYYMQSKDPKHFQAAERNWQTIRESYGQVPGGMFGGDENCRPGYTGPRQAIETCGIVEMMLSHETLLRISGDVVWADRCEDVAFNSMPAAFTPDYKALRYLTAPNQVLSDKGNKAPGIQNDGPMFLYNPHSHRCCQHNYGHGWPYYIQNLWQATPGNGLAAVLYAPSTVTAKVGDGTEVSFEEQTHYPFDETIVLQLTAPKAVQFPLYLRIPGWCSQPALKINGKAAKIPAKAKGYLVIDRKWNRGDSVELTLPMQIGVRVWRNNKNSISIDRGPLTYSLKIGEQYVREGGTDAWPAWELHPTTPWNYGLDLDLAKPYDLLGLEVVRKPWPASEQPFVPDDVPLEIKVRARKIPAWQLDELGLIGEVQQSPARTSEPIETVTLIPMGAARLRISAFPTVSDNPDAHVWIVPRPTLKRASWCNPSDSIEAAWDGKVPSSSADTSIPRFTWWDHKGTAEWIQYDLGTATSVSSVQVYWFDDTGKGGCRLPKSWKVLYRDGEQWKDVAVLSEFPVVLDGFCLANFKPVTTDALRVEVQLQPGFSGGILEMQVK